MEEVKQKHLRYLNTIIDQAKKMVGKEIKVAQIRGWDLARWVIDTHTPDVEEMREEWEKLHKVKGGDYTEAEELEAVTAKLAIRDYGLDLQGKFKGFPHQTKS